MFEQAFKNIDDVLRKEAGCTTELDNTEQTSWLLFLKYLDGLEQDRADEAALGRKKYAYILDKQFRWESWAAPKGRDGKLDDKKALVGDDLRDFVDDELFPYLRGFKEKASGPNTIEYKIGEIFGEIKNKVQSGYNMREIIDQIDGLSFRSQAEKHELSHLYEAKIKNMGNAGRNGGEYYTPRPLIRAIIRVVQPKLGERIYDGAVGSAGFLCEAYDYLKDAHPKRTTAQDRTLQERTADQGFSVPPTSAEATTSYCQPTGSDDSRGSPARLHLQPQTRRARRAEGIPPPPRLHRPALVNTMSDEEKKRQIRNSAAEFLIFTRQAGEDGIEVRVADETVWLTQKLISVLFDKGRSTISEHLKNIFDSRELDKKSVCRDFRHTAGDRIARWFENETGWLTEARTGVSLWTEPLSVTPPVEAIVAEGDLSEHPSCKESLQVRKPGSGEVIRCQILRPSTVPDGNYPEFPDGSSKPLRRSAHSRKRPMSRTPRTPPPDGQFLVYQTQDGKLKIDVRFEGETVWLTQQHMAELFQTTKQNVSLHIQHIFMEGELVEGSVVKESLTTAADGKNYATKFYNLDVIISVGYRVKSHRGTQFRIWATQRLREYIVKGFVLDDERLKNPDLPFDYFEELTRRIQDIRTSERRFYQKITDIYATSIDYDPTQEISIRFFQTVQNKVHWAITGHTAAEIVHDRVDATKPNLGLTNWRGATIRKQDVAIAKNYLTEPELAALNNLVEQYLIFAEGQAMRRVPMHMADWVSKLDAFLKLNDRDILTHAGSISHEMAQQKAERAYESFKALTAADARPVDIDFDEATRNLPTLPRPKKP